MNARDEIIIALSDIDPKHLRCVTPLLCTRPAVTWRMIMKRSVKWTGKLIGAAAAAVIVLGLIILPGLWQDNTPIQAASPTEEEPLRICFDVGLSISGVNVPSVVNSFSSRLKQATGLEHYVIETIPGSGAERESTLEHLRTELLTGGGPDVFILETDGLGEECLFQYPKRAMTDGAFYDLTELLKEAQYMEPEKLTAPVLAGGQINGRQVALPLTYSFWSTVYKQKDVPPPQQAMTWTECAQSDDPAYVHAAGFGLDLYGGSFPADIFGDPADYQKGKLSFSQQELEDMLFTLFESRETLDFEALPMNLIGNLGVEYSDDIILFQASGLDQKLVSKNGMFYATQVFETGLVGGNDYYGAPEEDLTYLPLFNRDGGVTARVSSWAAVNANSRYPRDAFTVLDYLFSEKEQLNNHGSEWNTIYSLETRYHAFSLLDRAGQESCPINTWWITDKSFESLSWVREQINCVRFPDPMEQTLYLLVWDCWQTYESNHDGDWREAMRPVIAKAYQELELLLAES